MTRHVMAPPPCAEEDAELHRWLDLTTEEPLEPDLPICDPHHHLWCATHYYDTPQDHVYIAAQLSCRRGGVVVGSSGMQGQVKVAPTSSTRDPEVQSRIVKSGGCAARKVLLGDVDDALVNLAHCHTLHACVTTDLPEHAPVTPADDQDRPRAWVRK